MGLNTVYRITNKVNGKFYIGSTIVAPEKRWYQHQYNSKSPSCHQYNYPLYCAMRKYGIDNFSFEIIYQEDCSEERIREIEREIILKENCLSPNGYNQTENTLHPINDSNTYKKIRETKRNAAKPVAEVDTEENILKIWRSIIDCAEEEGIDERKISAVCRGERKTTQKRIFRWLDSNGALIIPSYERDKFKGKQGETQVQSSSKQICKIDLLTNEVLNTYSTIALAARENNCDPSGITKVCKGKRNSCGGFKWKYQD